MKRCPDCRRTLTLDAFPLNRATSDGRAQYCKPCHTLRMRRYRVRRHGSERSYHLKRRYGVTAEQVDLMARVQRGRCAICKVEPKKLHVDHDHRTGVVRGLLCFNCNAGLGQVDDQTSRLRKLADYLRRFA